MKGHYTLTGPTVETRRLLRHLWMAPVLLFLTVQAAWAGFSEGSTAFASGDYARAMAEWQAAAKQGDAQAQFQVGILYQEGRGVAKDDAEATKWYRMAAEQGFAPAQYALANMYLEGRGVAQDERESARWFTKVRESAERGDASAQNILGYMYAQGHGVPYDSAESEKWYAKRRESLAAAAPFGPCTYSEVLDNPAAACLREAAERGVEEAQFILGLAYWSGRKIERDPIEAYKWLTIAAIRNQYIAEHLKEFEWQLTAEQVAEARKAAREWAESHQR